LIGDRAAIWINGAPISGRYTCDIAGTGGALALSQASHCTPASLDEIGRVEI
jgi:hypothetical protein